MNYTALFESLHCLMGNKENEHVKKQNGPGPCGSVDWALSCKTKGRWFNSRSGHMPGLRVWFLVGACMRGNQSMFLSFSFFLPCECICYTLLGRICQVQRTAMRSEGGMGEFYIQGVEGRLL